MSKDDNVINLKQALMPASKRRRLKELEALKQAEIDIESESRAYAHLAILTLAEICDDGETDSSRIAAANALLDRGYGKPKQGIDVNTNPGQGAPQPVTDDMTDEQAAEAYANTLNS